jgi:hypothetical protein
VRRMAREVGDVLFCVASYDVCAIGIGLYIFVLSQSRPVEGVEHIWRGLQKRDDGGQSRVVRDKLEGLDNVVPGGSIQTIGD